jgi:uncharacterized protein (TIGR02147 family)
MKTYNFDLFKDFFEYHLRAKNTDADGRKIDTLHSLAKKLGYNSPSTLSMISSGERLPSRELLEALLDAWTISPTERERIRLKVEIEKKSRKGKNHAHLISEFNRLTPYHKIDLKNYNLVQDWFVLIIKLLISTPGFVEDPQAISLKLRKKVTPAQVKKTLALLTETGLVARDPITGQLRVQQDRTITSNDIPSEAIRENHKGMIRRALESVEEQSITQRHLNSLALQFDMEKMAEAKKRILDFVTQFNDEFHSEKSDQIYQLNVQLFEHTNGGNKNDH